MSLLRKASEFIAMIKFTLLAENDTKTYLHICYISEIKSIEPSKGASANLILQIAFVAEC